MYSKELKIKLGLSENATDAEVDAKLASLNAAATRVSTLEEQAKATADAAFDAKVKDKLTPEEITQIKGLANRDSLADMFIAAKSKTAPAPPPVGNPLAGAAAAAAAPTKPLTGQFATASEELREAIGTFESNEKLEAAAMTSPLKALAKCLGVKSLRTPPEMVKLDQRILANRKEAFEITTV